MYLQPAQMICALLPWCWREPVTPLTVSLTALVTDATTPLSTMASRQLHTCTCDSHTGKDSRFLASSGVAGTCVAMSKCGAVLLGIDRIHHLLSDTSVVLRFKRRGSVVAVSMNLVADGFGRFGLDGVCERVDRSGTAAVVRQGRVTLVVEEVVARLVLTWVVRCGADCRSESG